MTIKIDPITLDLIENALLNARFEMDSVVVRVALSPVIREQHDEFPMICNERGQMVVGQFGSYIPGIVEQYGGRYSRRRYLRVERSLCLQRFDFAQQ